MARIIRFFKITPDRPVVHATKVECSWSVIRSEQVLFLQLDTYGSTKRLFPGKKSQTIQLDETMAAKLDMILHQTFPNLTR